MCFHLPSNKGPVGGQVDREGSGGSQLLALEGKAPLLLTDLEDAAPSKLGPFLLDPIIN